MKLEDFKPDKWWSILAVTGGLIAIAAVPAQFISAFLIGLGLLFFGAGESINRARRTDTRGSAVISLYKVTHNPWRPTLLGLILDALGIFLFGVGVFWLLAPHAL
jgi:hypothetical protein